MEEHLAQAEKDRLQNPAWKKWGPYVSDRQWGTVREDYSANGDAWGYTTHDMARSKTFRWGEDGIAGISDEHQLLCFSLALWNGKDPILKERFFGLNGPQGNHGEDVKEMYYYLDALPSQAYMKMLYKYPLSAFPYQKIIEGNAGRSKLEPEFEIQDTGVFRDGNYADVFVEYARTDIDDILIRIHLKNQGKKGIKLHVLPTVWFRNTWDWGYDDYKPNAEKSGHSIRLEHRELGIMYLHQQADFTTLFCDNETNNPRIYRAAASGFFKDGINEHVVGRKKDTVNPQHRGTKAAVHAQIKLGAGQEKVLQFRLTHREEADFADFDAVFTARKQEADAFYGQLHGEMSGEAASIQRQAFSGMIWSKQFYHYDIQQWLDGDPAEPAPDPGRQNGRNHRWKHLNNAHIISMPDKWEYPWYAAWDLAFHCIPFASIDADFAKNQLELLTKEWFMHPNGELPAYEWNFSDSNPPVHAWATWRVYKIDEKNRGKSDLRFLETVFHKLMINFTWWVNRKDKEGNNIFEGGFLGLDNIGVFDRSAPLPTGGRLEQADGTSWMAMYSLNMMRIALELARYNPVYQDLANKFFEHFLHIAQSMSNIGGGHDGLWDDEDGFFYDVLKRPDGDSVSLKVRSIVGLIPLFAVEIIDHALLEKLPNFASRIEWFFRYRPDLAEQVSRWQEKTSGDLHMISLLRRRRLTRVLERMLDENEFLSPYGIRSLSKIHEEHPYEFFVGEERFSVEYTPGESTSGMFGGNSNWRGPVWMPINYLIIESLERYHHYYGDEFRVECPTGSGNMKTLKEVADEISTRLCRLFLPDEHGRRPAYGNDELLQSDPEFSRYTLFHEYFNGDNGRGMGASHQTGWTGLVAKLLQPERR
ncbi:MAG: glucosidase [Mucilaginibacter polytrichastri]|nr:glucosidase [Mucilaginibacter polytrichastri]